MSEAPTPKPPPFKTRKPADRIKTLKILVYGQLGSGKTHLVGTAAADPQKRFGRLLLLAPDPGDLTVSKLNLDPDNIDVKDITDFEEDFGDVYEYLVDDEAGYYGTVAIDGLTDAQQLSMQGVMRKTLDKDPERDPDLPGLDQWGKNTNQVRKIVRAYRDLDKHVIMTALAQEIKDEKTGQLFLRPALSGKLANEVGAYFDIVIFIFTRHVDDGKNGKKVVRVARCQPDTKILAKDRTGKLGIEVENPTLPMLLDMILAEGPGPDIPAPPQEPEVKKARPSMGKK